MPSNIDIARRYLEEVENGAVGEKLAAFFAPEVEHVELPNRLNPGGVQLDLPGILVSAERGQRVIANQRYAVRSAMADGDRVALEVDWTAQLKVPFGSTPAGGTMKASFAVFITFRDGLIVAQRNYDCFEPF